MLSQTVLQVALADPDITIDSLRAACQDAIGAGKDQAQLIDALLTLARSQRGLDHREPVDLTAVVRDALALNMPSGQLDAVLDSVEVSGDARLLHRLVSNLIDNANRYNIPGGHLHVTLAAGTTDATLTVSNTGPRISPDQVNRLLEPFQRADPDRNACPDGLGLGLPIVAEIAAAHRATLEVQPRPTGGLIIAVGFPPPDEIPITRGRDRLGQDEDCA